jgi:hypothetical protein
MYLWLYSPCGLWPLFEFLILYTFGRTPWTGDQPISRQLPTHRTTQSQNKRTQTFRIDWDSNPRSQCSSGRRRFMPYTARPLSLARLVTTLNYCAIAYVHTLQTTTAHAKSFQFAVCVCVCVLGGTFQPFVKHYGNFTVFSSSETKLWRELHAVRSFAFLYPLMTPESRKSRARVDVHS